MKTDEKNWEASHCASLMTDREKKKEKKRQISAFNES